MKYFCSHGYDIKGNHRSNKCNKPYMERHWYTTQENSMGGAKTGMHKIWQVPPVTYSKEQQPYTYQGYMGLPPYNNGRDSYIPRSCRLGETEGIQNNTNNKNYSTTTRIPPPTQ